MIEKSRLEIATRAIRIRMVGLRILATVLVDSADMMGLSCSSGGYRVHRSQNQDQDQDEEDEDEGTRTSVCPLCIAVAADSPAMPTHVDRRGREI